METGKENRGLKVTDRQKRTLVEYMKQNPQLISGKFSSSFTIKDSVKEWTNLTDILNSIPGGAKKEYKSWRKCWQDMRSRTKSKYSVGKTHANSTGGGPPIEVPIDDLDEKIIDIIKTVSVEGHEVAESTVEFSFTENQESKATKSDPEILNLPSSSKSSTPKSHVVPSNNITSSSHKSVKRKKQFLNSSEALASYQENLEKRGIDEQQYRTKKLCLMERQVSAQERLATAQEKLSTAQERSAIAHEELKGAISELTEIAREFI